MIWRPRVVVFFPGEPQPFLFATLTGATQLVFSSRPGSRPLDDQTYAYAYGPFKPS